MPSVLDTPELIEDIDVQTLPTMQPQARRVQTGFWHTLVQSIARLHIFSASRTARGCRVSVHQMETPQDLLARQYPSLYIRASCGV